MSQQQSDLPHPQMSVNEAQRLSDQISSLLQRIEALEHLLISSSSEPEDEDDAIRQITDLLSQLVQNGDRQERLLWEIRQALDSGTIEP
jgi:hypothetical protein